MSAISAVVDAMKAMSEEILSLREQVAALESREVCTVAHENVETCGYCQRDALTAESAALRDERALIIQRAENAEAALVEAQEAITGIPTLCRRYEARLAEAEALLAEVQSKVFIGCDLVARIDAHLAREGKP